MIKKIINFKSKNIWDELDIYYCAFRIPDLVYSLIVMGAISAGFIPVFISYRNKKNSGPAKNGYLLIIF